jgi:hypothetical protein
MDNRQWTTANVTTIWQFAIVDCRSKDYQLPIIHPKDLPLAHCQSGLSIADVFAIADRRLPFVD